LLRLHPTRAAQLLTNRANVGHTFSQRLLIGVNGVTAKDQWMTVLFAQPNRKRQSCSAVTLIGQRRNPRVRMKAEARSLWHLATTAVQKNKRFEVMPKVTRADQVSDKTMLLTVGAKNNLARCS
jgi:hypothetical protein